MKNLQKNKSISNEDKASVDAWLNAHDRDPSRIPAAWSKAGDEDYHKNRIWYNHVVKGIELEQDIKAKMPETRGRPK